MKREETIRIATTKTLSSGNRQVKFVIEGDADQYGYLLLTEPKTVGDILEEIKGKLEKRRSELQNVDPFFPVLPFENDPNFLLFSA